MEAIIFLALMGCFVFISGPGDIYMQDAKTYREATTSRDRKG